VAKHVRQDNSADSPHNAADRYRRSNYSESAAYYDSQRSRAGSASHTRNPNASRRQNNAALRNSVPDVADHGGRGSTAVYQPNAVRATSTPPQGVSYVNPNSYARPVGYIEPVSADLASGVMPVQSRKRKGKAGKIALGVFLVLLLAVGGLWLWYSSQLDSALSEGTNSAELERSLSDAELGKPFYALVLGSDSREGSGTSSGTEAGDNQRSDVIILLRVDTQKRLVTMLSIPRDTPFRSEEGELMKINELYNRGGAAATIKAVSDLTGVPISHYAEVHFSELEKIVDALGGVTVTVDRELGYYDALTGEYVSLQPGTQKINGQQAQIFARARHEYENYQDASRQNNVRALAAAIMKSILDRPLPQIPGTTIEVAKHIGTDVKSGDLVYLATMFILPGPDLTVYSGTGPFDGEVDAESGLWLCYENPEGWQRVMAVVDSGGDPSTVSY